MKKLATLLLAAGMVVSASAPANAMDVKVGGFYRFTFEQASEGFQGQNTDFAAQRMRLDLTFTASENLKGFTQFQMGTTQWGTVADKHGDKNVQTRQAYIDWTVPGAPVKVRMGRMAIGLPNEAFGDNSFLSAGYGNRDGVVVTAKATDWLGLTALWVRASNDTASKTYDIDQSNKADVFGLAANLKFDGISGALWGAYATIDDGLGGKAGKDSTTSADGTVTSLDNRLYEVGDYDAHYALAHDIYAVGGSLTLSYFDPFTLKLSAAYAEKEFTGAGNDIEDRKGWNVQALASYKLGFGTPILGAWYGAGDDADEKYARQGWMPTVNGRFLPSMGMYDAAPYSLGGGVCNYNIAGTWGVQAGIENVSFLADLTHEFKITYIQGTNNTQMVLDGKAGLAGGKLDDAASTKVAFAPWSPAKYMTTADSVVDITLVNTYNIYKNLTACLEVAYMINNFDDSADMVAKRGTYDEDDWRAALTFNYKF